MSNFFPSSACDHGHMLAQFKKTCVRPSSVSIVAKLREHRSSVPMDGPFQAGFRLESGSSHVTDLARQTRLS